MTSGRHQNESLLEIFCRLQVEVSELMTGGEVVLMKLLVVKLSQWLVEVLDHFFHPRVGSFQI